MRPFRVASIGLAQPTARSSSGERAVLLCGMAEFSWQLPDRSNWSFQEIQVKEPERAEALEAVGDPDALVEALKDALQRAIIQPHGMRLGREHLNTDWSHVRAVCQFPVGTNLFDCQRPYGVIAHTFALTTSAA